MAEARLKRIEEQVIVVTGASSGIGLTTARMAAARGARVVLAARNAGALENAVRDIEATGGIATHVVADVANADDVERIADAACRTFGRIDTWVNNASSSIYGHLSEITLDDKRRLFDVTFWGVVHGCRAAVARMRTSGGAIINVGSVTSDQAIPLLGIYSAAKHAVKAYTDALRMELEHEGAPIAVSLVKPSSIDTMFFEHARNYMDVEPKPIPPVYAPDVVAGTILHCAEERTREITVGSGGRTIGALGTAAPALTEKLLTRTAFDQQRSDRPTRGLGADNLYDFAEDGRERGPYDGMVREQSLYTAAARRPWLALAAAAGAGMALALVSRLARGHGAPRDAAPDAARTDEAPTVVGDTRIADTLAREAPRAAMPPAAAPARPARRDAEVTRPVMAAFADLPPTSTEDSAASHLLDGRLRDASSLDDVPPARGSLADAPPSATRGRTDEDWLLLG